jgi:hypothetical protein
LLNTPPWLAATYLTRAPFPKRAPVLAVGGKLLFDLAVAVWFKPGPAVHHRRRPIGAQHLPARRRTPG